MKTLTSIFNNLIKGLTKDILFEECDPADNIYITILEPTCNMDFVNTLKGITKYGKIITQQYDYEPELMYNDFSDIISPQDKRTVIEELQKYI